MTNADSNVPYHAFIAVGGLALDIGALPNCDDTEALGINDSNAVVGYSQNSSSGPIRAFRWQDGHMVEIMVSLGPNAVAEDINTQNWICGWMGVVSGGPFVAHAFLWHDGVTIDLGVPQGAISTRAIAINDRGDVCGCAIWPSPDGRAFLRRACAWIDGQYVDLGLLAPYTISLAYDINDAREIVGESYNETGGAAVIWRNGTIANLKYLIPPGGPYVFAAHGINNKGQIAGEASLTGHPGGVAFRLTPALPATPGDTNCDGHANVNDLLAVIINWNPAGPVGGNPADLNRDNKIDVNDLLAVILHWG